MRAPVSKIHTFIFQPAQNKTVFLTIHINSSSFVVCPSNITGHAGIITSILQPNSFKVQASITANINVGIGNQLPKE